MQRRVTTPILSVEQVLGRSQGWKFQIPTDANPYVNRLLLAEDHKEVRDDARTGLHISIPALCLGFLSYYNAFTTWTDAVMFLLWLMLERRVKLHAAALEEFCSRRIKPASLTFVSAVVPFFGCKDGYGRLAQHSCKHFTKMMLCSSLRTQNPWRSQFQVAEVGLSLNTPP